MELKIDHLNYKNYFNDVTCTFDDKYFYGIIGLDFKIFVSLLTKKIKTYTGDLFFDKKASFSIVDANHIHFYTDSVKSEINYYCKINKIVDKNFKKIIEDRFSQFKLDILDRKINSLSSSEIFMFYFFINTLFESNIYIFNNVFNYLDRNNKKIVLNFLNSLKYQDKIVIIFDEDNNLLYNYTDYCICFNNGNIIFYDKTDSLFTNVDFLINNNIKVPFSSMITYLAKKEKGVRLFYSKDVRDIMKDIYKHV